MAPKVLMWADYETDCNPRHMSAVRLRFIDSPSIDPLASMLHSYRCSRITGDRRAHFSNQGPGHFSWWDGADRPQISDSPSDTDCRSRWAELVTMVGL